MKLFAKLTNKIFQGTDKRDSARRLRGFFLASDSVLDVGSLSAPYTRYLTNRVVAVDIPAEGIFGYSRGVMEYLSNLGPNFSAAFANAEALPFATGSFDKIICTEVLEHIADDKAAVAEMARVLSPTGAVFVSTPNGDVLPLSRGIKEHLRHYTKIQLGDVLGASFGDVRIESRFKCFTLMCWQYDALNRWAANRLRIWWLFPYFFLIVVCELIVRLERLLPGEGYNLVAVCANPRQ